MNFCNTTATSFLNLIIHNTPIIGSVREICSGAVIMAEESPRVLSIQSHVVSGYVGNKSATFPLQLLGFEVDGINSVQFSNHTGYKKVCGQILTDSDLGDIADGLRENQIDCYTHLLSGYVGSETFLRRISSLVQHLRKINSEIIYVCDPVMGDNGKMYVPKELLPIYRDEILPLANIITPNQYEVELLTGCKLNNVEDAWEAIEKLHQKGCQTVVVSSSELGNEQYLLALASTKIGNANKRLSIKIPRLQQNFTGTGDLFASLFLAWMHKSNNNLKESLEKTVASLQAVLIRTYESAKKQCKGGAITPRARELKLIQSKRDIEEPKIVLTADIVA